MELANFALAQVEPDANWQSIESQHFVIIYDAKNHGLAQHYAHAAELAYARLESVFSEKPKKIILVLNDNTDDANGFATRVPRPLIHLFPTLPKSQESIAEFGDWAYELVLHEIVHVMNFEPANGVYSPLRGVFGSISSPLMLLPRWWLEGLAVELETRLSAFGRLRSPAVESLLRAFADTETLDRFNISLINESSVADWPVGQRPYLFGAILWHELLNKLPESEIDGLTQSYSRRVPFLIETPLEQRLGKSYQEMLDQGYARVKKAVEKQLNPVRESEPTVGQVIRFDAEESRIQQSAKISPNGLMLAYIDKPISEKERVVILRRRSFSESFSKAKVAQDFSVKSASHLSWDGDGRIVYDKSTKRGLYGVGQDLFAYDLEKKQSKRITHQKRAREADVNSKGEYAFIQAGAGKTFLSFLDQGGENLKVILESDFDERFGHPLWLNDEEILYTVQGRGKKSALWVFHLPSKTRRRILDESWDAHFPAKWRGGITFSAMKSGIPNVYLMDDVDLSEPIALTNGLYGFYESSLFGDTLVASQITHRGKELLEIPSVTQKTPPVVESLFDERSWPKLEPVAYNGATTAPKSYRAGPYLWPQYWIPFVQPYDDGLLFQATTVAEDPLARHVISVTASYDTYSDKPSLSAGYAHERFNIWLEDSSYVVRSFDAIRRDQSVSIGTNLKRKNVSSDWSFGGGLSYANSQILGSSVYRSGPYFRAAYAGSTLKGRMISPESGKSLVAQSEHYLQDTSNLSYNQFKVMGSYYFSSFLPKRHALAVAGRVLYTSETIPIAYGGTTSGAPLSLIGSGFLMRGYYSGQFLGPDMYGSSLEYRFPLGDLHKGFGTLPLFFRRMHSRLVLDAITLDGVALPADRTTFFRSHPFKTFYYGAGLEFYLDTTAAYSFPFSFFAGIYQPLSEDVDTDTKFFFGFLL